MNTAHGNVGPKKPPEESPCFTRNGRIRIMHVVPFLTLAGMEHGVIKVVNRLDRNLFEPFVCCLLQAHQDARAILEGDVQVVELRDRKKGFNFSLVREFARILRELRIDVVHSHNWPTFLYTNLAAMLAGVPVIVHGEHGRDAQHPVPNWKKTVAWALFRRRVNQFVAVSENIVEDMERDMKIPAWKTRFIPNGVDTERFRPGRVLPARPYDLPAGHKVIGWIAGWIRDVKDFGTLIGSFRIVKERYPECVLVVVGESTPSEKRKCERLVAEAGLAGSVRFLGGRTDIAELMAGFDLYLNSSIYEGMSNTILEAMASGIPVVATNVGGTPRIVSDGETGILVPCRNPQALAEGILRGLKDPGMARRLGENGRAKVLSGHSLKTMVGLNEEIYLDCIRRSRTV